MSLTITSAIDFYERHPITADIILAKLKANRGSLDGLVPTDLFPHDQDHYGGVRANDELARAARMAEGKSVADFCAGLGGPARYWAYRFGVTVTGIELTPARVRGAAELTRRVGLVDKVRVIEGDVQATPLADASQDAVVSQEAFLHVPGLSRAFAEAHRILKPGGRLAFTNWIVHRPLTTDERTLLWDGMAAASLLTVADHIALLREAGFTLEAVADETEAWGQILAERLAMYEKLRGEAAAAGTPAGHDAFYRSYILFVRLVQENAMGGGRFTAVK